MTFEKAETPLGTMVGAAWIEHATPTMATCGVLSNGVLGIVGNIAGERTENVWERTENITPTFSRGRSLSAERPLALR
jgi:hypothetical protein